MRNPWCYTGYVHKGILNKGLFFGILIGIVIGAGFAVRAAWTDPSQAPPSGGYIRVNTTGAPPACSSTNAGQLWYDTDGGDAGTLKVCDGTTSNAFEALN